MNPDLESDRTNIQALIALWQAEENRLRSILEDPQTLPSIKLQVSERLRSVRDQIQGLADELGALVTTD